MPISFGSRQKAGDRSRKGTSFKAPALAQLCPVTAYLEWIELAGLTQGAVFRGVDRWGHVRNVGLHINSLVPLLRSIFVGAGIAFADQYSGHSLRRGFAHWATSNGWDIKTLMEYVGWKNMQSALRYVDGTDPFARHRIDEACRIGERATEIGVDP
ncbi:MAG: tyrosine-type recombinase/integrase [Burkholderiaceae bacterium]|nr:tyrosine-type recombinase/integrase [Burkholderiaceae bacterium]